MAIAAPAGSLVRAAVSCKPNRASLPCNLSGFQSVRKGGGQSNPQAPEPVNERELVARARAGDAEAERLLYDAHVDRVYRLAYRLAGDDDLARDLTQETFIRAFERLAGFRGEAAFGTWLYAVAMSVVLDGLRRVRRWRRREAGLDEAAGVRVSLDEADPDLKEQLTRAVDALPLGYRTVFVMHDVEGYTHEEIGAALGIPVGTSKARLSRARARLRGALARFAREWTCE